MMLEPATRNLKLRSADEIGSAQPTLLFIDCGVWTAVLVSMVGLDLDTTFCSRRGTPEVAQPHTGCSYSMKKGAVLVNRLSIS